VRPVASKAWGLACEPVRTGRTLKAEDRRIPSLLFGLRLSASVRLALYPAFWFQLANGSVCAVFSGTCRPTFVPAGVVADTDAGDSGIRPAAARPFPGSVMNTLA